MYLCFVITPVADKPALLHFLKENGEAIRRYGVEKLGLFGSFKYNTQIGAASDVDFLVDFVPGAKNFRNLMDLGYFLEDNLGRKIDLITRASLKKSVSGPHITLEAENVPF